MTLYESAGFNVVSSSSRWTKPIAREAGDDA
jgi:hypothetical protein